MTDVDLYDYERKALATVRVYARAGLPYVIWSHPERDAEIERAIVAEREACAKVAEAHLDWDGGVDSYERAVTDIASAIRARK